MAMEAEGPPRGPQSIGMDFVEQYYKCFYQFPEKAQKYYQDFSVLSRPGPNGVMTSVTTIEGINDIIISLGNKNFKAEILTTDTQLSHKEGIIVLVTGCLTGKGSVRRKFAQSFFLAPEDKGYFVLNDVFRYIDEEESASVAIVIANGVHENLHTAPLNVNPDSNHALHQPIPNQVVHVEEAAKNEKELSARVETASAIAKKTIPPRAKLDSKQNGDVSSIPESESSNVRVDSEKISYASMVKVTTDNTVTTPVLLPTGDDVRAEIAKPKPTSRESAAPEGSTYSNSTPKSNNDRPSPEVKSFCVHIRNLPLSTRVEHVERIFKKYGTIKQGGIQVRSYRDEATCFAFVEFENSTDMEKAVKASPIKVDGGREVTVDEKKIFSRGSNGRDRNPPRRDGFQNDQIRDRGNFVGERGHGRNEVRNREVSGRTRGHIEIDEDGFQRVCHNKGGRVTR